MESQSNLSISIRIDILFTKVYKLVLPKSLVYWDEVPTQKALLYNLGTVQLLTSKAGNID